MIAREPWVLQVEQRYKVKECLRQDSRQPMVSEKQLGKRKKYSLFNMSFPWISFWTFRSWKGRVPIPVPSCLQGCKMHFITWETSVQSYCNGLLRPSVFDSQTLALVSTRSRILVSCPCHYTGTAGGYLICQEAACTSDIFWSDAALGNIALGWSPEL